MTLDGMIEQLQMLRAHGTPGTALIQAWNPDSEQLEAVSGLLYDHQTIEICTDDND